MVCSMLGSLGEGNCLWRRRLKFFRVGRHNSAHLSIGLSKAKGKKHVQMQTNSPINHILDSIKKVRLVGKESWLCLMGQNTKEISEKAKCMVKGY